MKILFAILLSAVLVLPVFAQEKIVFEEYGFSIEKLTASEKEIPDVFQTLIMFLPAESNFAPNVNVQIQKYQGTIADYVKLSLEQFKTYNMKIVKQEQNDKEQTAIFEYTMQTGGLYLHFYSKALSSKGKVYLVTGTTTVAQWIKVGGAIKKNVDSFQVLN
ncbi:MAG: photosystem II reaction center PsbP family protein [Endomicrobium sp.]|jgi:hypothetical protein|nr:photosystem II reaction center PsbP family protein [Endomicrobium sp.]